MNREAFAIATWSYASAALAYSLYLASIHLLGRGWGTGRVNGALSLAVALSAAWAGAIAVASLLDSNAMFSASIVLDALRYGSWYAFLLALMLRQEGAPDGVAWFAGAIKPVAYCIVGATAAIQGLAAARLPLPFDLARPTWFLLVAMIIVALVLLEQLARNTSNDSLWHIKPLALGLGGAFAFDLYMFSEALLFGGVDTDTLAARGFVHASVVPLLWMSTTRTRDWLAKIRLSQKAAFHSASLLFVGAYLLFMAGAGYYIRQFGGTWGKALAVTFVSAALLLLATLVVSRSVRASLRVTLGKHFVNYRYDYREEWLRFTNALAIQDSQQLMGQQVVRGLADLVESPAGSLWLKDATSSAYRQVSGWNVPACDAREPADSSLCRFIVESGWVINLEEYRSFPGRYTYLKLPPWIGEIQNAWLVVPLMGGTDLIGFAMLSSARTSLEVNWEVNDLLRTAGRQAASFLAQMRATEALLEVQKFDAFNRMSAFVVHDLKNIVTQLSLLLRNAEKHSANPEFQADMRMTVQHSVERMRQLMLQLREGATPPGTPVGVDLARIVEKIRNAKTAQGRKVDLEVGEHLMTRGHEERIERVIGHLVQNALEAVDANEKVGRVWIKLSRHAGQAMIEVGDTGAGMDTQFVRERLFKPFQTTKRMGMGIGAYESQQYVQELGGKLMVDSTVGVGTRFTVQLPLFETGVPDPRNQPQAEAA